MLFQCIKLALGILEVFAYEVVFLFITILLLANIELVEPSGIPERILVQGVW
jgi:hypothetical protein